MDIVVCVKTNPDLQMVRVKDRVAQTEAVPYKIGDLEKNALETAVALRESGAAAKVTALCLAEGNRKAAEAREAEFRILAQDAEPGVFPYFQEFTVPDTGERLVRKGFIALGALVVGWVFMNRSFLGYQMKVAGQAENAGRYAGFSAKRAIWMGMLVGGGMAGIAGMSEVAGPVGQITEHISPGYGFAAMIVAFVGRLNPVGIFFSSLLLALIYLGGEQAQQYLSLPYSISNVFQGMLLFFLLASDVFINYRPRLMGRRKVGA